LLLIHRSITTNTDTDLVKKSISFIRMNRKQSKIILSTIVVVFALFLNQCEASRQNGVVSVDKRYEVVLGSPSSHINTVGNEQKTITVRNLKENRIKSDQPFFHTLLATIILNGITVVALLSLIPVLLRQRWSFFKSAFWAASDHQHEAENTRKFFQLDSFKTSVRYNLSAATEGEKQDLDPKQRFFDILFPAFFTGMILAVVLFLILPESIELIQTSLSSSPSGEVEIISGTMSRFGTCVMIGFLMPLVLGALCPRSAERTITDASTDSSERSIDKEIEKSSTIEEGDENGSDTNESYDEGEETKSVDDFKVNGSANNTSEKNDSGFTAKNLFGDGGGINNAAASVLIGDSIHNFFDGMFIGVSFMTCSTALAIFVTMVTLYIDVSQKLADYFLVTKSQSMSIPRAILLIFTPSILLIVGSLVILASEPDEMVVGVFLAFAAGLFLHVSASVTLPRVHAVVSSRTDRFFAVAFFVLGALPVGLCLVTNTKCNA